MDSGSTYLKQGDNCTQTQIEARWLAQIIEDKQTWFHSNYKRYTSSMESLVGSLTGELRYNVMFLRINSEDSSGFSFYTPTGKNPRTHANNLFLSISRDDNSLLEPANRKLWVDSRYRTGEFTEDDLKKICPDCLASKDHFKAAIVSKFVDGKIDLWILEPNGVLNNAINGCKN